jgi:hypothetical protein
MRYMVFVIIGILTLGALADNPFEPHHFDARKKLTERLDEVYIQGLDLRKTYDRPCQQAVSDPF